MRVRKYRCRPALFTHVSIPLGLVFILALTQGCLTNTTNIKSIFLPPNIDADSSSRPYYEGNVSQVKYWDRISTLNHATNFAWWDSAGTVHQMYDYYNKVVVLTFFGSWSPVAINQLTIVDSIRARGDTNILWLAIAMREGTPEGKAVRRIDTFAHARGLNYQVLIGSRDFGFTYGGIDAVPTTFVIDFQRKIASTFEGYVGEAKLLESIQNVEMGQP